MPSREVKARKTKVKVGGKLKGRSLPTESRSSPSCARRLLRSCFCFSRSSSLAHLAPARSVPVNSPRKKRAIFSTDTRSAPRRRISISSRASHTPLGSFSYTPKTRSTYGSPRARSSPRVE
jgi:hypothetical protein